MRKFVASIFLGLAAAAPAAEPGGHRTNQVVGALESWDKWTSGLADITCKAAYYRRMHDGHLVPVAEAQFGKGFSVDGIVLSIVEPNEFKGKVVAFHFDFPEEWDHWYLPDCLYRGQVQTGHIGRLNFMCDPGCFVPVTDPLPWARPERLKPFLRHRVWGGRFAAAVKEQLGESVLFDALYSFLTDTNRSPSSYADQETAARLLIRFQPACGVSLSRAMRETFGGWDVSIGEWPWYLGQNFGRDKVLQTLDELEKTKAGEAARDKIETWRFWMTADEAEKIAAPRKQSLWRKAPNHSLQPTGGTFGGAIHGRAAIGELIVRRYPSA
jgi:hypothetical protein